MRKGEKGITIIAPMLVKEKDDETEELGKIVLKGFRGATVFDISQTEGEPLPEIPIHRLQGAWENWPTIRQPVRSYRRERRFKRANVLLYRYTKYCIAQKSDERHIEQNLNPRMAHGLLHVPSEERL
ncbi:hypothetical protein FY534_13655 (plasmid) [Alicyclobacillus sp. TC]|uniref:hypothetical protein n=1 Tax=Alicyclobacillus sp. TC TaxID=2606450 RepID=UPI001933DE5E|nr:hypothetical protein [Alicyclobacillus sp. TC]QRF24825.1 hypothetical protein FY534_13655 [Alicyclobacillus sp. TC]